MDQRDRDVLTRRKAEGLLPAFRRLVVVLALGISTARQALAAVPVRLVPTDVEATPGRYAPAAASQDREVRRRDTELDRTVAEALEDMGLEVRHAEESAPVDGDVPAIAGGGWAFAPRLELRTGGALVRIVAVSPASRVLLVREEDLAESELGAL